MATQKHNVLILNGPNLNMLGVREPDIYGFTDLSSIARACGEYAAELGLTVDFRQSNHEGELITFIQEAAEDCAGLIINAGGYSHTSVAIMDALKILSIPIIEVHLSNIYKRETFRHHSYVSAAANGVISGLGGHGYILALDAIRALIDEEK